MNLKMLNLIKAIFFNITFNGCLLLVLMISIQNSSTKNKVNFIFEETIYLPVSFIVGTSFICGSIFGNLLGTNLKKRIN